ARTDEATRTEEVVGNGIGRSLFPPLNGRKEFDCGGDPPGRGHAIASGRAERSASSVTWPRRPYSSGWPVRLTQKTLKPNARAPNASQGLDEKKPIASCGNANRSAASWYTRGSGLNTPTASTLSTSSSSPAI